MKKWKAVFKLLAVIILLEIGGAAVQKIKSTSEMERLDFSISHMENTKEESLFSGYMEHSEEMQGYYFQQLEAEAQYVYLQMLEAVQERKTSISLTVRGNQQIERIYYAMLNDHPELFWAHNRNQISITTYSNSSDCVLSPQYLYTDEEILQIEQAMENAWQEVNAYIPEGADTYEKIKTVYTYVIDHMDYVSSEHDQNLAGAFWKRQAVCAGYAKAMQYLLERMGIFCIYVEGDMAGSPEGHAWNIVKIDEKYYYVDATNGDQPEFLEGNAAQMADHKTTIYDYLCPFPEEYETQYFLSEEFSMPDCIETDKNFYVLNQGCFDFYDPDQIYEYCCMRLDYGAAVIRFKFRTQEAYEQACTEWIENGKIQDVAQYYMEKYGLRQVEYYYGKLEHLKTLYFMF